MMSIANMKKKMENKFTVIRDTREQLNKGWNFIKHERCLGTDIKKLDTGDYTIKGLEKDFIVERKGAISEFVTNLFSDTFWRELDRLSKFEHPYLILEFPFEFLDSFPTGSGIPSFRWKTMKLKGPLVLKKYHEMRLSYPSIRTEFVGGRGKEYSLSLFKRIVDLYGS